MYKYLKYFSKDRFLVPICKRQKKTFQHNRGKVSIDMNVSKNVCINTALCSVSCLKNAEWTEEKNPELQYLILHKHGLCFPICSLHLFLAFKYSNRWCKSLIYFSMKQVLEHILGILGVRQEYFLNGTPVHRSSEIFLLQHFYCNT